MEIDWWRGSLVFKNKICFLNFLEYIFKVGIERFVTVTVLTTIGGCLTTLIVHTIADSFSMGFYAGIMIFGNIILPVLGTVLIYTLIKAKTTLGSKHKTIIFQFLILLGLLVIVLVIWAVMDFFPFETLSWTNIKDDFNSKFLGYLPVAFSSAILIPVLDIWLTKERKI